MVPVIQHHNQSEPQEDSVIVEAPQSTRARPPQLNETVVGQRSGAAINVIIGEDDTDSDVSVYNDAQEGVETTQQVNTGQINVQAPFVAQWFGIETRWADYVIGPDGFKLGESKIIHEDYRLPAQHNRYDHPAMMRSFMKDSCMSDMVGSPSSMVNEVFSSDRGSKTSSTTASSNSTPDQSLILSYMHGWIEVLPTADGGIEMSDDEQF